MRAGRGHRQTDALGSAREFASVAIDLVAQLVDISADLRAHLDDRLVHFTLDLLPQHRRARSQELGHVRSQLSALGVDDLEFFLDAESEGHGTDITSVGSRESGVDSRRRQSESAVPVGSPSPACTWASWHLSCNPGGESGQDG